MSDRSYEVDFGADEPTGAELERLTRAGAGEVERAAEAALRPKGMADFIGQPQVREQLSLVLDAAAARGVPPITSCCPVRRGSARRRWR